MKNLSAFGITIGNINRDNARGKGNKAARRAGWRVIATAGPEYIRQMAGLYASI